MRLKITLNGDPRLRENVILVGKAAARRLGLKIKDVKVIRKASTGRKARKPTSGRKPRARA